MGLGIGVADLALIVDSGLQQGDGLLDPALLLVYPPELPRDRGFSLAVSDDPQDFESLLKKLDRLLCVLQGSGDAAQIAERDPLAAKISDLAGQGEAPPVERAGALQVSQGCVGIGEISKGDSFPSEIPGFLGDFKTPIVELDGAIQVSQSHIGAGQIAQGDSFALEIANFVCGLQPALEELDRTKRISQTEIGAAQIPQGLPFSERISGLSCNPRPSLVKIGGLLDLPEIHIRIAQTSGKERFGGAVSEAQCGLESRFQPIDPFARMPAQIQAVRPSLWIFTAPPGRLFIPIGVQDRPGMSRLNVVPLPVEESEALEQSVSSLFVTLARRPEN
ncbi:MAG TPA: hypothetical protein VL025_13905, partial [Thermoanaerobaculia bacterium]|nr:hypothetical protein [Thermoanaerobaculia bacterium]